MLCWTLENGTDRLFRNVDTYQSTLLNMPENERSQSASYSAPTKCVLWSGAVVSEVCVCVAGLFPVTETY
jgi:hypothetical protein